MNDNDDIENIEQSGPVSFIDKYRFLIMIIISVAIAFLMVAISLALYKSSGAYQLDLSRPGYNDVRDKIINEDNIQNYSDTGTIDQASITSFKSLYAEQENKAQAVDAFSGDPLSPENLGLVVTSENQ